MILSETAQQCVCVSTHSLFNKNISMQSKVAKFKIWKHNPQSSHRKLATNYTIQIINWLVNSSETLMIDDWWSWACIHAPEVLEKTWVITKGAEFLLKRPTGQGYVGNYDDDVDSAASYFSTWMHI